MSTPLIAVASILAVFALILIPLMMFKPADRQEKTDLAHEPGNRGRKPKKKKKR